MTARARQVDRIPAAAGVAAPEASRRRVGALADRSVTARNEVLLVGRVSGEPEERELPSGDVLVTWRVVVDRPAPRRPPPEGVRLATVDTLDCVAWTSAVRRTASALTDGDVVAVEGALRRRFWRAGAGAASRTEVEVLTLRRVGRRSAEKQRPAVPVVAARQPAGGGGRATVPTAAARSAGGDS